MLFVVFCLFWCCSLFATRARALSKSTLLITSEFSVVIMPGSPFRKDLFKVTFADIENLKDAARAESEILEYKEEMPARLDLQKEVLGFANNIGGYLIVGVKEKKPEGTIEDIVGIYKETSIKEKVVSIVRDNSSPQFTPNVHLVDIPEDSTKCIAIVYSHESDTVHRASDGRYYYRTENETIPIRPEFVAKIIGKEKISARLIELVDKLDWKKMPERIGINVGDNCWLSIICCPIPPESFKISIFSETEWYNKAALEAYSTAGSFDKRSTADSFRVLKVAAGAVPNAMIEYFENGIILYGRILYGMKKSINEKELAGQLGRFLNLAAEVYSKNSFDGGLILIVGLGNINGWSWTTGEDLEALIYDIQPSSQSLLERRYETTVSVLESGIDSMVKIVLPQLRRHFNIY